MKGIMLAVALVLAIPVQPAQAGHRGDRSGYDQGDCDANGDCGGQSYDGQWSNEDHNRNRNRNRGAFSPGPFDRSPVDASHNQICVMPGSCSSQPPDKKENPK